ncbi:lysine--tRNA ligase-like [Sitodiplosis mosellana]|uniref:lysine--tRNA ligase-like n=1 Tax=Sitodiplosis mosellana TaxID=263140 RepID=UPI002444F7E3|nr:lysine--tRNA ligase-like [Sitodiplosis mosellana]
MADATGEKLSKNELKRRLKAEQKTKEKAEKEKEKEKTAVENGAASAKKAGNGDINEAEISPNEFFKLRSTAVEELKKNPDTHPYPHKFNVTLSLENFIEQYNNVISDGVTLDVTVSVAGRIHSIRNSGAKLIFYDLRGEGVKIQVMANARGYVNEDEYAADTNKIKRGDIIGIEGSPGKTKKGELSIIPKKVIQPLFRMKYIW